MSEGSVQLQFAPFSSALDAGFWPTLSKKKLEEYKLDDQPRDLHGYYYNGDPDGVPCRLCVEYNAFEGPGHISSHLFQSPGTLINFNTLNAFREIDKKNVLEQSAKQNQSLFTNRLNGSQMCSPQSGINGLSNICQNEMESLRIFNVASKACFKGCEDSHTKKRLIPVKSLQKEYDSLVKTVPHLGFFLVVQDGNSIKLQTLDKANKVSKKAKVFYGFCDPCTLSEHPGWPLRNYLALIASKWLSQEPISIICYRDRSREGQRSCDHSIVLEVNLPSMTDMKGVNAYIQYSIRIKPTINDRYERLSKMCWLGKKSKEQVRCKNGGFEFKHGPQQISRIFSGFEFKADEMEVNTRTRLGKVQQTKCLLLGAGTLGCNVARCLIGWGVRTVTFVDNSTVSYSNPVRQSLFEFEDSQNGGKPKAATAAEKLKKIFPGVTSSGHQFSIPMPGHAVGKSEAALKQVQEDVGKLEALIESHDVIYLLMDTRESRWLPTLIAASKRKLVVNAALGFDTYLVLRHGLKTDESEGSTASPVNLACIPGHRLGCYFCNDVVAPGNSTRDRTLDQQCTVSRPGLSMVAAALAVELMVSLLQHPNGGHAAADTSAKDDHLNASLISPLGLVPISVFGICDVGYREQGFNFLLKAFNQPSFLEDHSGLTTLHQEIDYSEIIAFSDDESVKSTE
ncbi:putative ubiquitin-like modifier-activating enzyme ATG7 isoform X2 [Apostichopus japonicus]|uniref:Putative ubiquitin-like modifier-activating enzyme ATG7 isoform X2 n=1 Tax=Stichopus japonicus TaxID=307972 RepID=A0A2G8KBB2_STIJA|nr:putative ubiquitin-like modifier-activating enzyme ATG7 isoform X2 [Apostichopus japonicus]